MSLLPPVAPPQPAHAANTSLSHLNPLPPSVFTLPQTAQLEALYTIIRDKNTSRGDFLFYSDRIIRLLVEEGLNHLPVVKRTVETPTVSPLGTLSSGRTQLNNLFRERLMMASALKGKYAVFLSFELGRLAFLPLFLGNEWQKVGSTGNGSRSTGSVSQRSHRQDSNSTGRPITISITSFAQVSQDEDTARPKLFYSKVNLFISVFSSASRHYSSRKT